MHNAQVYNLPNSGPVRDVLALQDVFKEELNKLVSEGLAKEEETIFPDLGEIPYATPEPDPVSDDDEDNEDDGEEDDEDEDGDGDDSDDDRRRRRGRRGTRPSLSGRKSRGEDDEKLDDGDVRKRRGRPPKVDTPMEARIKSVLKGLRKLKDEAGNPKVRNFERLPDKGEYPAYFMAITDPIALDSIKKKSKRKKYQSLEQFMKDIDLLYNNAKHFNEEGSEIYNDAVELQAEAHKLLDIEKAKPDDVYLMEDGRRPLPSGILYKNELWKVGDWIHISNPNDITKPIIAQIYRTWEDSEGQKWINACWYYRPEQTIHQHEKHFFPNEVVKTGQYRDHKIEEVVDRCFVMFVTRYSRGRPRGVDPSKEVYVCEARYNEEKHRFNKIKTWASCLPDEVRDKDYEMDLFDQPRRIKKVPSPLKHLLKDHMKETDEIPSPQWGHPNAPPIVGAIHKHPRDENVSLLHMCSHFHFTTSSMFTVDILLSLSLHSLTLFFVIAITTTRTNASATTHAPSAHPAAFSSQYVCATSPSTKHGSNSQRQWELNKRPASSIPTISASSDNSIPATIHIPRSPDLFAAAFVSAISNCHPVRSDTNDTDHPATTPVCRAPTAASSA